MNRSITVGSMLLGLAAVGCRIDGSRICSGDEEGCISNPEPEQERCDLSNGGLECGACAVACDEGWICVGTTCALIVASGLDGPTGIVVDVPYLYFTTFGTHDALENYNQDGSVQRLDLDGGGLLTLASAQERPSSIAVDANDLFWVNGEALWSEPSEVLRLSKSGGAPSSVASSTKYIQAIALDESSLYWIDEGTPEASFVMKSPKAGGAATVMVTEPGVIAGVAVDADTLYWSNSWTDTLSKRDPVVGATNVLASASDASSTLTRYGGALYWVEYAAAFYLKTVDIAGGADATTLATELEPFCTNCESAGLSTSKPVTDGVHVYWVINLGTERGGRFLINRTPVTPAAPPAERFADFYVGDDMGAATLALHDDFLYVAIHGRSEGMIVKLAK